MKWNDAEVYFATESGKSERHHWPMEKDDTGKYALIREEELIGILDDSATAIHEGHRRFGSHFVVKDISDSSNDVVLGILPALVDEEGE